MFIRWERRRRVRSEQCLIAKLVESHRVDDKPRQRIIAHLGTCTEPVSVVMHRYRFYRRCDEVLAQLALSPADRERIESQLAARIPRPSDAEVKRILTPLR